jgi:hypothetical protein
MANLRIKLGPPGYCLIEEPPGSGNWVDYHSGTETQESEGPSRLKIEEGRMAKSVEEQLTEANKEIERLKAGRGKPLRKVRMHRDRYGVFYSDAVTSELVSAKEAERCEIIEDRWMRMAGGNAAAAKVFRQSILRKGGR